MALNANELYETRSTGRAKRFWPGPHGSIQPKTFDGVGGAPLLEQLTPVIKDPATNFWLVWTTDSEEQTVTIDATGGVYTLVFDGESTASLTYLNTAGDTAVIQTALEGLSNLQPGDVTVVRGTPAGNVTIFTVTFGGQWANRNVPQMTNTETLTGGGSTLVNDTITGGAGYDTPDGFVYEAKGAQLHATDETIHNVLMGGTVHAEDIVLPAGESQDALDAALRNGMRAKGFIIQGLVGVS